MYFVLCIGSIIHILQFCIFCKFWNIGIFIFCIFCILCIFYILYILYIYITGVRICEHIAVFRLLSEVNVRSHGARTCITVARSHKRNRTRTQIIYLCTSVYICPKQRSFEGIGGVVRRLDSVAGAGLGGLPWSPVVFGGLPSFKTTKLPCFKNL